MKTISTAELAARLGVDRRHVYRLTKAGRIPGAVLTDAGWRYPHDAVPTLRKYGRAPKWAHIAESAFDKGGATD